MDENLLNTPKNIELLEEFENSGYSDPNFRMEYKDNSKFPRCLAEAKVWKFLIQNNIILEKTNNFGPDFKFKNENFTIFIEVTSPNIQGKKFISDYVEGEDFETGNISKDAGEDHCSFWLSAIKKKTFGTCKDNGRAQYLQNSYKSGVTENDPYILAISNQNASSQYSFQRFPFDIPHIISICFGIEYNPNILANGHRVFSKKKSIKKENGSVLKIGLFEEKKYNGISAILACDHYTDKKKYILIHNPNAKNPLTQGIFKCEEL